MVARVGDVDIEPDLVGRVATARKGTPRDALDALIDDALLAEDARTRGLDSRDAVANDLRATRGRFVVDRIRDKARAAGGTTDAEVEVLSAEHWQEVDCPEQRVVIHALVVKPKNAKPLPEGASLGDDLARAVAPATNDTEFEHLANAVPRPANVEIRVERLPAFTADGRVAERGSSGSFDTTFTRAAFALPGADAVSPVVETSFGWHVIRVLRVLPPRFVPIETRRGMFLAEAIARRAQKDQAALLRELHARHPVSISDGAEISMARATTAVVR
jgi:hypothetical protein